MNTDSSGHRDIFQINFTSTTHEAQDHNRKKPSAPPKALFVDVGLSLPLMADNQGPGSAPRGGDLPLWVAPLPWLRRCGHQVCLHCRELAPPLRLVLESGLKWGRNADKQKGIRGSTTN